MVGATPRKGFLGGSVVRNLSACNAGDPGSIPGLGGSPGKGNDNPLHYSCLENSMDRGAWWIGVLWDGVRVRTEVQEGGDI